MVSPLPVLLSAPTRAELFALVPAAERWGCRFLITGIGPGATALALARFLEREGAHTVLLAGLGGAYPGAPLRLGACCLATVENYGDLGRYGPSGFEPIRLNDEEIHTRFPLEEGWRPLLPQEAVDGLQLVCGPMVTVSSATGTAKRAHELYARLGGFVENMEGAAAAQVCAAFGVPLLELRGVSNMVGDLDRHRWRIEEALTRVVLTVTQILEIAM